MVATGDCVIGEAFQSEANELKLTLAVNEAKKGQLAANDTLLHVSKFKPI